VTATDRLRFLRRRGGDGDAWHAVELARHQDRPYTLDYLNRMCDDFVELHGDRAEGDDPAIVAGIGSFRGQSAAFVGHQKGRDLKQRTYRNFGMPSPEGYRKAMRVFSLASRLGFPIVTLIDTPGAAPGVGAEQRGQSGAIARAQLTLMRVPVPVIACVIGQGSSGGAPATGSAGPGGGPSSAAGARARSSWPVTAASATRRPNRFETAAMAAAVACVALAAGLDLGSAPNTAVFLASGLALLTLAWIVGVATEQLGESSGPKIGGVLNATFGNAAELIITIFAIRAGQLEVATASITGSILGNTLLVLGASFVVGGLRHGTQTFDRRVAGMNSSMLALAVIGLGLPTAFAAERGAGADAQTISDVTAAVLIVLYGLSLVYFF